MVAISQAVDPYEIHLLMPHSGAAVHSNASNNCLSWRLAVETDNIIDWYRVPEECESYIEEYMLGKQYTEDCNFVATTAYTFAESVELNGDGTDIWVFDVDDTAISNLPYYSQPVSSFGTKEYNATAYDEWVLEGKAPALPATLDLDQKLLKLGYKIVFISGRSASLRNITITNMKNAGYHTWEKLITKEATDTSSTALVIKSKQRSKLVKEGYSIIGNFGDQWSDLWGSNPGKRTYKLPDPVYFVG